MQSKNTGLFSTHGFKPCRQVYNCVQPSVANSKTSQQTTVCVVSCSDCKSGLKSRTEVNSSKSVMNTEDCIVSVSYVNKCKGLE